jgi:hypothetical protein
MGHKRKLFVWAPRAIFGTLFFALENSWKDAVKVQQSEEFMEGVCLGEQVGQLQK